MLDRKTKDVDASVELLEDRAKRNIVWYFAIWVFGIVAVYLGAILDDLVFFGSGILLSVAGSMFFSLLLYMNILIVLRRQTEKLEKR